MAENDKRTAKGNAVKLAATLKAEAKLVADEQHPDFVGGRIDDGTEAHDNFTPNPSGPIPFPPFPQPEPLPKWPIPTPFPGPIPRPFKFCGPVSGKYQRLMPPLATNPGIPGRPVFPVNMFNLTVRVDVDRFYPQHRISLEAFRLFPRSSAHAIAEVVSDTCLGFNRREIVANITYRDGNHALIPGTTLTFSARRGAGLSYAIYQITFSGSGITPVTHDLGFTSQYFDPIEFEIDTVDNAGSAVTTYDTGSHPNRPANLPAETLSLASVYQRAGFDVSISPNASVISARDSGADGTWSDSEMHNAMITYWSRFADKPNWALWVLFARQHDQGRSLGGVMFDDIGPNHRQGTSIFTDSFIQDHPAGDPNPAAWQNRMVFWTATHEMGHAFNLAHSWQKSLGEPWGNPWIPLTDELEARSFMNYPYNVAGGQAAFFADFAFRFSDNELIFMRHAPRRFVQMGNEAWFTNHGFEEGLNVPQSGRYQLKLRPNRDENIYRFLEPVTMELKLTNNSGAPVKLDGDMLSDGKHFSLCIQREGGQAKIWRPMITRCHESHAEDLEHGKSLYGAHLISASTSGWLIDEPGFYKLQAAVSMGDEIVVSNVVRLWVQPPQNTEEGRIAGNYFTEDVGRVLNFSGAPALQSATNVLRELVTRCPDNPAVTAATIALFAPELREYKQLDVTGTRDMKIASSAAKIAAAAQMLMKGLLGKPAAAAQVMGHITYFDQLRVLADAMAKDGNKAGALKIREQTITVMKERAILASIIEDAEQRLKNH
ncbi:MAG: hypothetical protein LZF61_07965 [Nitrosomonas sp.]|nr:MAG: hypothetical protein LZF61_07965 [Nitrosomonas sp.]